MKVIKRDGRLQSFDLDKIETSILNATLGEELTLNESDIKIIVEDVEKSIKGFREDESNTSSYEITGAIINILRKDGFEDVIKSYIGYSK